MRFVSLVAGLVLSTVASQALSQVENGDFRVRAKLRTPDNGAWGANESVGNVEFRVHSRFLQLYYGGVRRADDFKFSIGIEFFGISGFPGDFLNSPYNTNYDVYINSGFVGRAIMNPAAGVAELTYDSRHATLPDLPLPANFPEPVVTGDVVRIFFAAASAAPAIGAPLPSGAPVFTSPFEERFSRGDVNQDGDVDDTDFAFLAAQYDPFNLVGPHIGPAFGDFTGDNRADLADYNVMVDNWTGRDPIPPTPAPIAILCPGDFNHSNAVTVQDVFDFLSAYFVGAPSADFNASGVISVQDIFDFLTAYFSGC